MGDTYGAWEVGLTDGTTRLIVAKAYATARSRALKLFGKETIRFIDLIATSNPAKNVLYQSVEVAE